MSKLRAGRRSLVAAACFALGVGWATMTRAQETTLDVDDAAQLLEWVPAEYPEALRAAKLEGIVVVEFIVDPTGTVSEARVLETMEPRLGDAALACVRQWKFLPALQGGQRVPWGMRARVEFSLSRKAQPGRPPPGFAPETLPAIAAEVLAQPSPVYPAELVKRLLAGQVIVRVRLDGAGKVSEQRVLEAGHPAFVPPTLVALAATTFRPARLGGLGQPAELELTYDFALPLEKNSDTLRAWGVALQGPDADRPIRDAFEVEPQLLRAIEPVYPRSRLLAGEEGEALVWVRVNESGATTDGRIVRASAPELGEALLAAVATWRWRAAKQAGSLAPADLAVTWKFTAVKPAAGAAAAVPRLLAALAPEGGGVAGAKGLDARLKPVWQVSPLYPEALKAAGTGGEVLLEFIVDRTGAVRLPLVVSAPDPALGWAAVTAVGQWVFVPPARGGEAVDVRVRTPLVFTP